MGWRLGECMEEPNGAALRVFNAVYGGTAASKLFRSLREERSLCYYASSGLDAVKGLLYVQSGIDPANYDEAVSAICGELGAIARGEISPEELDAARSYCAEAPAPRRRRPRGADDVLPPHERHRGGYCPRRARRALRGGKRGGDSGHCRRHGAGRRVLPERRGGRGRMTLHAQEYPPRGRHSLFRPARQRPCRIRRAPSGFQEEAGHALRELRRRHEELQPLRRARRHPGGRGAFPRAQDVRPAGRQRAEHPDRPRR